jgi:hypothetical protein
MAANTTNGNPLAPPASTAHHRASGSVIGRSLIVVALIASALFAAVFVNAQEGTPGASSTPEGTPAATPTSEMPRLELELEELNDSGIDGTVTLYDAGERTIIEFDVDGAGGDHPANISAGVCGDLDPEPAYELEPVDEEGQSLTVIDATLDELLESEHAVDLRLAPDQLGTLIACANIEGEPELPSAATPEATPTGEGGQVTAVTPEATETPDATEIPVSTIPATVEPTEAATEESTPTDGTGGTVNVGEPAVTIPLRELNDSGVTGTVELSGQGQATRISIQVSGDAVTGDHIAHLHSGTCEAPGDYTYTLNPVNAEGSSETVVNLTLDELLTGGYMVNIHPSEQDWDAWMACAELRADDIPDTIVETPAPTVEAGGQVTTPAQTPPPTTTTPVIPVQTIPPATTGDGTAGVTGTTVVDTSVETLPQTAGVGAMLDWPSDPRSAVLWATAGAAIILAAAAVIIRRGERAYATTTSRWTRLGI